MEQYFEQLRNFSLMRKREGEKEVQITLIKLLLDSENPLHIRIPETLISGFPGFPAALLYTGSRGVKAIAPATSGHLSDFMNLCSTTQSTTFRVPLCIALYETAVSVMMDTLTVSSLWHRCTAQEKQLILRKYILSQGDRQLLCHSKWKRGVVTHFLFANKHPHCDSSPYIKLVSNVTLEERFLTTPMQADVVKEAKNTEQMTAMMEEIAEKLKHYYRKGSFSVVVEFEVEFVWDSEGNWVVLRLLYCELNRKAQAINQKQMHRQMTRSNPGSRGVSTASSSKRLSRRRPVTQTSSFLVFPISPLELKQITKLYRPRQHLNRSTVFIPSTRQSIRSTKSLHHSPSILSKTAAPEDSDKTDNASTSLLPIFQFPTPRDGRKEEDLGIMRWDVEERLGMIRKHIIRQNNSLYMRIHYQNELPEQRLIKELYKNTMDKAITEMDRMRARAKVVKENMSKAKNSSV